MTPENDGERDYRRESTTRSNLPALSTLLVPVGLGMLLLGMISQAPRGHTNTPQEVLFTDGPQRKPMNCNKSMSVILQQEYRLYQRCISLERPFDPERRRLTQEAVDAYNEVAGDTDPSAFRLTTLPRHLDYPYRAAPPRDRLERGVQPPQVGQ